MVGESYSPGIIRHRTGYGPTLDKIPNPYWWEVKVFSGVGPIDGFVEELFDFQSIGGYYSGFYSSVSQLGLRPEPAALVPPLNAPATNWGASHKLSGCAAIGGNYLFDKEGRVFANGRPQHGVIARGELSYDPRLDDTYPGGVGACRLGDESTYVYSGGNPAIEAAMYAYGRYEGGVKIFGLGVDAEGIDWPAIVDWANDCDANSWEVHGTIYEGGQGIDVERQRIGNLDDLCAAGGGRWFTTGAKLSFDWHRPRVPVATLTDADLLEEGGEATALQSVRERMNGVRPQYISPAHNWQQITADEIVGTTYRTEDGRALTQTWPLNLVKDATQAGQLATYAMADSREIGPIPVNADVNWRFYRPGEAITFTSEMLGYDGVCVIARTDLDPETMGVPLTLKGETAAKHAYAMGEVAVPPPTPLIGQTQEERDAIAASAREPSGYSQARIRTVSFRNPRDASDVTRPLIQASEAASSVTISIAKFDADYIGADADVTFAVEDITTLNDGTSPIAFETRYYPYMDYDPLDPATPAVYGLTTDILEAQNSATNKLRHAFGAVTTPADGSGATTDGSTGGGGGGGGLPPDGNFN